MTRSLVRHGRLTATAAAVATAAFVLFLPAAASAATPSVFTSDAFSTGATTATIQGFVNPQGQSTTYQFQWDQQSSPWCQSDGSSGSPAHTTSTTGLGFTDLSYHGVSTDLTGLTTGTAYCAQVIATNGDGETDGGTVTWTQGLPLAETFDVFSTSGSAATVEGDVDPAGQSTTYALQWDLQSSDWCQSGGTSSSPAHTTTAVPLGSSDTSFHDVSVNLSALTGGTEYCAQLIATNASGEGDGGTVTWTQGIPSADTFDAFSTGATTATVEGDVNPIGQSTTYEVQYGAASSDWCQSGGFSGSPANTTTPVSLGFTDNSFHDVSVSLSTGLSPGTDYCAEIVATNASGTSQGFQTQWAQGKPSAGTSEISSTGATTATVQGSVNASGQSTTYQVQYDLFSSTWCTSGGSTGSPANTTSPTSLGFTDSNFHDVSVGLTSLTPGSHYCARVIATNASGEDDGSIVDWIQGKPLVDTFDAVSTGATTATVDGTVNPTSQTTTWQVQYDLFSSTWCATGGASGSPAHTTTATPLNFTDNSYHDVQAGLTGLTAGTKYCAHLSATNGSGTTDGGQVQWTEGSPSAETFDAFSTSATAATVEGDVNPAAQSTTYALDWDVASSNWCTSFGASGAPAHTTTATPLGSTDTSFHDVSVSLPGLTAGTTYCAALKATNAAGTDEGDQVQWTQGRPTAFTSNGTPTGSTTATVSGQVNPAGQSTNYDVAYDVSGSLWCTSGGVFGVPAHTTAPTALAFTDGTYHDVSVGLTGLTASTSYCGAVVATNASGSSDTDQAFWTQPALVPQHALTVAKAGTGSGGVTSSPAGINCGATCAAQFDQGTQVTLTATASGGSVFAGWSGGGCSGTGTCIVTLNSDTAVTATFNTAPPVTHTLNVSKSGTGSGGVTSSPAGINCGATCSQVFNAGTQITLTAAADSGSTFTGWSGGGCSGTGTCVVTLNADTTVTATFTTNAPPPPAPKCVVPKVKGKTLAAAKKAITKAHCSVGKITKVKSSPKNKGKVISQSPKPGKRLARGSKVALKVGK